MATKLQIYNDVLVLLGDARLATLTDDVAGRFELDNLYDRAVLHVTRQAAWHHTLITVSPVVGASVYQGFTYSYLKPANWLRTHAIFTHVAGRESPVDARETGTSWATNINTGVYFRYIASGISEALWTEGFVHALTAYLAFALAERVSGKSEKSEMMFQLWRARLAEGSAIDAMPDSEWLPAQLDGSMQRAAEFVLNQGYWWFATKVSLIASGAASLTGYLYSHAKPADWIKTRSIYTIIGPREFPIDVRELGSSWHSNSATGIYVRYVSRDGLLTSAWPESFSKAVLAFIRMERAPPDDKKAAETWSQAMEIALNADSQPDDPWLTFQLDGSMLKSARAIAEDGLWNFAEKRVVPTATTSTVSGYGYRYLKPADWLRTIDLYEPSGPYDRYDVPWIDDGGYLHTNSATGVLRYVSTTNIDDASKWPQQFAELVLAHCQLHRLASSSGASGAAMQARRAVYEDLLREAKAKDSARSRTRVNNTGVIIRSRFGSFYGEQGRRY